MDAQRKAAHKDTSYARGTEPVRDDAPPEACLRAADAHRTAFAAWNAEAARASSGELEDLLFCAYLAASHNLSSQLWAARSKGTRLTV